MVTEAGSSSSIENWKDTLKSITTYHNPLWIHIPSEKVIGILTPEGPLHPYNTDDYRDNGENNLTTMLYMMDG